MKKGEFDLTGKAIDCRGLPALGDVGKEIFRALKVACNGRSDGASSVFGIFHQISEINRYLCLSIDLEDKLFCGCDTVNSFRLKVINPSDVLGQAVIDAALDGATIVFEGNVIPVGFMSRYWPDGSSEILNSALNVDISINKNIIAYKLLDKKPRHRVPSIESRVLAEKAGFKELRPVCSPKEWKDREAESYDELRDAHLELVRENMLLAKENEALAQRIKNLHRAINDAKACLDE